MQIVSNFQEISIPIFWKKKKEKGNLQFVICQFVVCWICSENANN